MKKIFTVLAVALAMGLAFTGCASKKAKENGPKVYRVDIGSATGGTLEIGEVAQEINISSLFPADKVPAVGDKIRVMWTFIADADVGTIYVSLDGEEYVLAKDISANEARTVAVSIPVKEELPGTVYVSLWSDSDAICETTVIDAK